jgi:hypothetical protein
VNYVIYNNIYSKLKIIFIKKFELIIQIDVDPCNPNPCGTGAQCSPNPNSLNGYTCTCAAVRMTMIKYLLLSVLIFE